MHCRGNAAWAKVCPCVPGQRPKLRVGASIFYLLRALEAWHSFSALLLVDAAAVPRSPVLDESDDIHRERRISVLSIIFHRKARSFQLSVAFFHQRLI